MFRTEPGTLRCVPQFCEGTWEPHGGVEPEQWQLPRPLSSRAEGPAVGRVLLGGAHPKDLKSRKLQGTWPVGLEARWELQRRLTGIGAASRRYLDLYLG